MTTPSGGGLVGDATIRVTADTDPAMRAIRSLGSSITGSLRAITPSITALGGIGAALGTAVPAAAAVAAAVGNLAPAATAAATGFVAIRLAAGTVQLAMVGVEDAISAAFATGEGSAEAFRESLEGLAPAARSAVIEIRSMREELTAVQQGVQQRFFEGFDQEIRDLSGSVLPILQNGLNTTSGILNDMAISTSNAAEELANDGTLGRAISGANVGLFNLRDVPAQIITAFTQLAAAGAPTFDRLTEAAANAATNVAEALSGAVESGALEEAVSTATDLLFSLAPIAADVGGILANIFEAASVGGGDLFQVLGSILDALNDFTGTTAFQEAIGALVETMGVVGDTVAPLLISALEAIAPVFTALAEPVQLLVSSLGSALAPIIEALAPVLLSAAQALGSILTAISPLLPVVGQLIAMLGPSLTPIFEFLTQQFQLFAPAILEVATVLQTALQPILAALPMVIEPILQAFLRLIEAALPVLLQLLIELSPTLVQLTVLLADLLLVLTPLIVAALDLATGILTFLMPAISAVIGVIGDFASVLGDLTDGVIRGVVMPAIEALTNLLSGDFSGAFESARTLVSNVLSAIGMFFTTLASTVNTAIQDVISFVSSGISDIVDSFQAMPGRVTSALSRFGRELSGTVRDAVQRAIDSIRDRIDRAIEIIGNLPERATGALGDLARTFYNAGRDLIQGFIDGIVSLAGAVEDAVGNIIDGATGWLPGSPAEKGPLSGQGYVFLRGQRLSEDFARGITRMADEPVDATRSLVERVAAPFTFQNELGALPAGLISTGGVAAPVVPTTVNLTLVNQGVLGSRAEVLDWLTLALDDLRRQRRLPQGVTA